MARDSRRVTIQDVARAAGVAASTVSRAFDPAEKQRIGEKTRKRVYRVAKRYGYRPNRIARALRRGGSDTIALIVPDTIHSSGSEYCTRVIIHAVAALGKLDFDLKIHTMRDQEHTRGFPNLLRDFSVDGLLITGVSSLRRFGASSGDAPLPVVMLNGYEIPSVSRIDADNIAGGRLAAEHFIGQGHVALGMLSGPRDCRNALDREQGYRACLMEAGLALREEWFVPCNYGEQAGYEAAYKIFRMSERPTALFCANDELALAALRAVRERGLTCPGDISIVGFDNFAAARHTSPPLTTIEQPLDAMVDDAVDHLVKLVNGDAAAKRVVFPVALVERESVAGR